MGSVNYEVVVVPITRKISVCSALPFLALAAVSFSHVYSQVPNASTPEELSKIAGWKGLSPKPEGGFSFVVFSDRTGDHKPGEWAAAVREANLLKPDFVICVGDLIEGYTEDRQELIKQWDEFDKLTNKSKPAGKLPNAWTQ